MKKKFFRAAPVFLPLFFATALFSGVSSAEKVRVFKKASGSFITSVAGTSVTQAPYIQIIRSANGFDYTFLKFDRIKNKITKSRLKKLRKKIANVDFNKQMIVAIFSHPTDNYRMAIKSINYKQDDGFIQVDVTYQHNIRNYRIQPKKSIHYALAVIPKKPFPVVMSAKEEVSKKNKGKAKKASKAITVTGRLMALASGEGLQLVPVKIRRGSKNSYYIKGKQAEELEEFIGKVITLEGVASRDRDGPYEFDLEVKKVVKVNK